MESYFKIFKIEPCTKVDNEILKKKYLELLKENVSDADLCAKLNIGFKILSDKISTMKHIVELFCQDYIDNVQIEKKFLQECFTINCELDELLQEKLNNHQNNEALEKESNNKINKILTEYKNKLDELFQVFNSNFEEKKYSEMPTLLAKIKFIKNIVDKAS